MMLSHLASAALKAAASPMDGTPVYTTLTGLTLMVFYVVALQCASTLAIAPIAVMTIVSGVREREHAIRVAEENLQQLTNLAAANEAQSIESARQILQPAVDHGVPDETQPRRDHRRRCCWWCRR